MHAIGVHGVSQVLRWLCVGQGKEKRRGGLEVDKFRDGSIQGLNSRYFSFWEVTCNRFGGMSCFFLPSEAIE